MNRMLSFEWNEKSEVIEIHADRKGLEFLAEQLLSLLASEENDHVHLMTAEWGGEELSSAPQNSASVLVNHVKVLKWK